MSKKIVILGAMTTMPVAGNAWLVVSYMRGLRRLGYDPYYVEAHARTPKMLMQRADDNGSLKAAGFIREVMARFGFGNQWAFHALHDDGQCYGMSEAQLRELYRSAAVLLNLHGGTRPQPEHIATGRLVYLETDPVRLEISLYDQEPQAIELLKAHVAFFTWGENYGNADCRVPLPDGLVYHPTRPPVLCDDWYDNKSGGDVFTTIGNWEQKWQSLNFQGEIYHWSKHFEYLKFLDLPQRVAQPFELALGGYTPDDEQLLQGHGWRVCPAMDFSTDLDQYRDYIRQSRGEFTVAKDQNIRLRSGWFSERSAQYLAAGRPVITQDTGFSNILPTGRGLFAFSTMDDILAAVDAINADYAGHCRAAAELAREYFNYDVVLSRMLGELNL